MNVDRGTTSTTPKCPGCDAAFGDCVAAICTVDEYCCDTAWDGMCVGQVGSV